MGVPKFFRYISERYPCLSELARDQCIPQFDNLYLDMNGIIHTCSHPDDTNFHFTITEENMFKDIFNYIDKLFFLIKPQKLFFMAVDGVAPRAKMNQQRSRRFRSAKDAELLEEKAKSRGEVREHERFDSNCITPGTEFMVRLNEALRYFVKCKISSDPLWQKCRVILSGHDAPGEGEHKIMDYIRYLKSQKGYDPDTRHCLYGLDADLIILGLCTHELHFVVLREEVKFGRQAKKASVEETRFFLLHLGLMREYLEMEFDELKNSDANFDIANLIDDWVLMGFLVGNDFIPHLPCMHISSNALPLLYKNYMKVYPTLGGNINEHGKVNLERLEKYFAALADVEFEIFQENHADLKYFEGKQTQNGIDEAFDFDISEITNENQDAELAELIENSRQFFEDDNEDLSDEEQHITDEFETYKRNYYMNKLNQNDMTSESTREKAICYITALQWNLDYYYRGVQSWDWYYPHHYAPFISDLKNFKDYKIKFNLGEPFLPFQQLLAVLPAASRNLLPAAYRDLMTSASSELLEFYPTDFETDLNGKRQEWEAVVLIPFIDEKRLLNAMKACENDLTPAEVKRNRHGPMMQYDYNPVSQEIVPGIFSMKALYNVFCTEKKIWSKEITIPSDKTVCIELPNAARTVFFPGFPTMKHLKYDFELKFARVRVFEHPSRNENLILKPLSRKGFDDVYTVAEKFLNQIVYTGWPHLIKAKVVGISNKDKYIDAEGIKDMEARLFQIHKKTAQEHLTTRMGIEFDDFSVLVHVRIHTGSTYTCGNQGKVIVNDAWSYSVTAYPAQGVVSEIAVHKNVGAQPKKVEHLFPTDSTVFFLGSPYFGSEGTVLNPLLVYECGRLKINITVLPEPDFSCARVLQQQLERDYVNSFEVSTTLGLQMKCLSRLTGTVLVVAGARRTELPENLSKVNIGLQLKFPKQHEERAGYCRRINGQWYYSSKAILLIQEYYKLFPVVFDYLSRSSERAEFCFEEDLFPEEVGEHKVDEIITWIKSQGHMHADRRSCGSQSMEKEAVQGVLDAIEQLKTLPVKTVKLQVKPHLLLKPDITLPSIYKPKRPVKLFDRVVVVKSTYMVPLGAKGTIIGVYPVIDPNPVRLECVKAVNNFYEILFDKYIPSGNDAYGLAEGRVYKVPETSLLLISTQDNKPNEMQDAKPNQYTNDERVNNGNSISISEVQQQQQNTNLNELSSSTYNSKAVILQQQKRIHTVPAPLLPTVNKRLDGGGNNGGNGNQFSTIDDFWMPEAETKVKHTSANNLNTAINASKSKGVVKSNEINKEKTIHRAAQSSTQAAAPLSWRRPQTQIMQQQQQLQQQQKQQQYQQSQQSNSNECQAETQALKSLLGLFQANAATHENQNINSTASQPTKHPALPQPPTSWRSDAQHLRQQQHYPITNTPLHPALALHQPQQPLPTQPSALLNQYQHPLPAHPSALSHQYQQPLPTQPSVLLHQQQSALLQQHQQPSALLHYGNVNVMPILPPNNYMGGFYPVKQQPTPHPMLQQQQPHPLHHYPAQFHMPHFANNVAHHTTNECPKSAFIPLQVHRGNVHHKTQTQMQPSKSPQQEQQENPISEENTAQPLNIPTNDEVANLQINTETSNTNICPKPEQTIATTPVKVATDNVSDIKTKQKRTPRVPKIGARFDNAH
ncbi:5'-3' exoribonuclease 1 isoform X2 [Eurosta solidaginis]|uniref:5'-3' exoribonuclease 1 isoform X2 n=1 Tax=Eurosta solidaginis TaxID=178769 RepID=UPI0035310999